MPISKLTSPVSPNDIINKTNEIVDAISSSMIGTIIIASTEQDVQTTSGSSTEILSASIPPGKWIIVGRCRFPSNATGARRVNISITSGAGDVQTQVPAGSVQISLQTTVIADVQTQTPYYLNAYQNSGSPLTIATGNGRIEAIRIA